MHKGIYMNDDIYSKRLIESLHNAKISANEDLSNEEKDSATHVFIGCLNDYSKQFGEQSSIEFLLNAGLNDYEAKKVLGFRSSNDATDLVTKFFKTLDLKTDGYISPLSENSNWLSKNLLDNSKLSDEYGNLIQYIAEWDSNQKAEFLAIIDRYVAETCKDPNKADRLDRLKNFNPSKSYDLDFLASEINGFCYRCSVLSNDKLKFIFNKNHTDFENVLEVNGGRLIFNRAKSYSMDGFYTNANGEPCFICVTSKKSTKDQQQLFKFYAALKSFFKGKKVQCFIYCDSGVRYGQYETNNEIKELNENDIDNINIVSAMRVFMRTVNEKDVVDYRDLLENTEIQLFNSNGGLKITSMSSKEKIKLLVDAVSSTFNVFNENKEFWLSISKEKDLQKRVLLDLCSSFIWLKDYEYISEEKTPGLLNLVRNLLQDYNLRIDANLNSDEDAILAQAKKEVGISRSNVKPTA